VILGRLYQVQDELTVVRTSGNRLLYRFASTGLSGQICIADDTGEILVLHDSNPRPVNSCLEKHRDCPLGVPWHPTRPALEFPARADRITGDRYSGAGQPNGRLAPTRERRTARSAC
jgi:hypothetical protein